MKMKIYTNKNNTATLKLLIAANLSGKKVELVEAKFEDNIFPGPRSLPLLVVDNEVKLFSSNAALHYLHSTDDTVSVQHLEWEASRLYPVVTTVLAGKVPSDLKQVLNSLLNTLDLALDKKQYLNGDKLSPADIAIWSTMYPVFANEDLKTQYMQEFKHLTRWTTDLLNNKAFQDALSQWGGSAKGPFGANSSLGVPQLTTISSPVGSPDDEAESGPTPEEIQAAKELWDSGIQSKPVLKHDKIVLPVKGRKNILITSALPYVNNVPHLGNIIGCVLSADIFARYCRTCGYNTLYISGTDEYGTATETKALEEGVTPREICDKYFEIHNSVYRWFNIGFDYFGRTSTPHQTEISQKLFLKLMDNGFVESQSVDQLFCVNCQRFLADRFVEGTCPHPGCLYDSARGDQCDKCGKLINAIELVEPKCKVCKHKPVVRDSKQLFIDLAQLEPSLRSWITLASSSWSGPARAVTRSWLKEPLRARAVTRDLKWGVPVPVDGYTDKVFYVWFDAPIGYMSITQAATKDYEKWWKPDKECDVKYYQFMAKDNVPFHCIMFPATLLGVNEGYLLVNHIFATEYLNYEEGKFSKSRGVGVFGTDAQDTGIPSDVWRFYLASIRPETSDSSFSWAELGTRNNSELLNNLGNFCHRSLSFCSNTFAGKIPEAKLQEQDYALIASVNRDVIAYVHNMEKGRLREALRHVLQISKKGNQHMQATQPWVLLKGNDEEKIRGSTAIAMCCQLVGLLCTLISPFMPDTGRKLCQQLNIQPEKLYVNSEKPSFTPLLPVGHIINKPEPLFSKIDPSILDELRAKYAGTQADRANKENGDSKSSGTETVAEIETAIAQQGEIVRKLKASTKDKSIWQPEVDKLLGLKKKLTEAQTRQADQTQTTDSVQDLEKAIAEQGDKVRKLKASTKDKSVWQPEVDKLLGLKKKLTEAQTRQAQTSVKSDENVADLEKAIAEQGEIVRKLKASTKDKSVLQPEVDKLLGLKKKLTEAQTRQADQTQTTDSVQDLEKAIAEQGDKVRKLKASTKDKTVWQPEVNVLLELKKKLANLQIK